MRDSWVDTGPRPTIIQPGGSSRRGVSYSQTAAPNTTPPRKLFEVSLEQEVLRLPGQSIGYGRARGLFLSSGVAEGQQHAEGAVTAEVRLTIGRPYGGAPVVRTVTLLPGGMWLAAGGWVTARLDVLECLAPGQVSWHWTTQEPPNLVDLTLVRPVTAAAGTQQVPDGADQVVLANPDPGWQWQTTVAAGAPLVVPDPQPGNGGNGLVNGSFFTPTVDNVAVWRLRGV